MNRLLQTIARYFVIARRPTVVRRSLWYMATVGPVLIGINHFDLLHGAAVDTERAVKILLTPLVPYIVCTLSSVQSIQAQQRNEAASGI